MPETIKLSAAGVDLSPRVLTSTVVVGSPAAAAETIVAQTAKAPDIAALAGVLLLGSVAFTVGTNGTAATLRLRQTGLAGTVVANSGALTGGIAAAGLVAPFLPGFDATPVMPGQVYVLTLQITAGSAVSTVSAVTLAAIII